MIPSDLHHAIARPTLIQHPLEPLRLWQIEVQGHETTPGIDPISARSRDASGKIGIWMVG